MFVVGMGETRELGQKGWAVGLRGNSGKAHLTDWVTSTRNLTVTIILLKKFGKEKKGKKKVMHAKNVQENAQMIRCNKINNLNSCSWEPQQDDGISWYLFILFSLSCQTARAGCKYTLVPPGITVGQSPCRAGWLFCHSTPLSQCAPQCKVLCCLCHILVEHFRFFWSKRPGDKHSKNLRDCWHLQLFI